MRACAALRPGGRLVVNAVTLETQAALMRRLSTLGGELIVDADRACRAGRALSRLAGGDADRAMAIVKPGEQA